MLALNKRGGHFGLLKKKQELGFALIHSLDSSGKLLEVVYIMIC